MKNPFKNWSSEAKAGLALSLGAVVIFTSAVVLSNNEGSSRVSSNNSFNSSTTTSSTTTSNGNTTTSKTPTSPSTPEVDVMLEEVIRPYEGNPTLKHNFYSAEDPIEKRQSAVVKIPGSNSRYIKSVGVDYADDNGKSFNIVASLSGTVTEKMNDSMYGNILVIEHKSGVQLYYASIDNLKINKGDVVKQGQVIATSGTSLYTSEFKTSLHFEIIKDGKHIDPEKAYSNSVQEL